MREKELREKGSCGICGKGICRAGAIHFYRVRVEQYIIHMDALQRQQGLTMMLGGHAMLARVMGPDEKMAACTESKEITVCSECIDADHLGVLVLEEEEDETPSKVRPLSEAP